MMLDNCGDGDDDGDANYSNRFNKEVNRWVCDDDFWIGEGGRQVDDNHDNAGVGFG